MAYAAERLAFPNIKLPSVQTTGIIAEAGFDRSFVEADKIFEGLLGPATLILLFTSDNDICMNDLSSRSLFRQLEMSDFNVVRAF